MKTGSKHKLIFLLAAMGVTPIALYAAWISAGGGHGDYVAARVLLPFACFTSIALWRFQSLGWIIYGAAIAEIPIYGYLLGLFRNRGRLILLTVHVIEAVILFIPPANAFFF